MSRPTQSWIVFNYTLPKPFKDVAYCQCEFPEAEKDESTDVLSPDVCSDLLAEVDVFMIFYDVLIDEFLTTSLHHPLNAI